MTFQLRHLFLALVLHGTLFALLAGGVQCSRKPPTPTVIQAVLLDPSRKETSEQKRREEQQRKQAEQRRLKEERQQQEQREEERRKLEAEIRRKNDELRQQTELTEKKKAEETARRKREEDQQRENERKARSEAEARESMEQAMRQETLQRQLDQEQRARAKTQQDLVFAQWQAQLSDKVRRNWVRPPTAAETFECKVRVQQLLGGQVTDAAIVTSCGHPALDDSVIKAVLRSDPLPTVADPSLYQREFTFVFVP